MYKTILPPNWTCVQREAFRNIEYLLHLLTVGIPRKTVSTGDKCKLYRRQNSFSCNSTAMENSTDPGTWCEICGYIGTSSWRLPMCSFNRLKKKQPATLGRPAGLYGSEIPRPTTVWILLKPCKQWDFNYQPQLVNAGFLNHQQHQYQVFFWSRPWYFEHLKRPPVYRIWPLLTRSPLGVPSFWKIVDYVEFWCFLQGFWQSWIGRDLNNSSNWIKLDQIGSFAPRVGGQQSKIYQVLQSDLFPVWRSLTTI